MKNILLVVLISLGWVNANFAQTNKSADIWKELENVTFKKHFDKELGIYVDKPIFGKKIKKWNNKVVTVKGYIIPLEGYEGQTYFIFSKFPYSMCFFCGGAGPETVMEVDMVKGKKIKYTSKQITIKGKLKLNDDNIDKLMYLLVDAVQVK